MNKSVLLINEVNSLLGKVDESIPNLTIKNRIELTSDIKSDKNKIIPRKSIVDITKVTKKGNTIEIEIESIDDEKAVLIFKQSDKFPHRVVK